MNHQKLLCYGRLLAVARRMPDLIERLPRGTYYIVDQLNRALSSAILNLCEGNERTSQKERNRFFDISLGSISEVAGAIQFIAAYRYISDIEEHAILEELRIIYCMVRKLKKSII